MFLVLLTACDPTHSLTYETGEGLGEDTGRAPIDVPCSLVAFETQSQWGAWLDGRTVPGDEGSCAPDETCTLSDGRVVEAAWHWVEPNEWVDGYQSVNNDGESPPQRAFVYVREDSTAIDACRITLR